MNLISKNSSFSIYSKHKKNNSFLVNFLVFSCFALSFASFLAITLYILINGCGHLSFSFFSAKNPNSILPEIINTLYVVALSLLIAVPTGIGSAIYLNEFGSKKSILIKLINFSNEILASVPSILFGMFGYSLFCLILGLKCSILAGSLTMAVCVLPTIVQTTKNALNSVPKSFKYAALAIGTSRLKTIFKIVVPCAMPGILTGIILAAGKIIGESAALMLTTGAASTLPQNLIKHIFSSGQTLSLHLYFIAGNSSKANSIELCFATATVLLFLTLALNAAAKFLAKRFSKL